MDEAVLISQELIKKKSITPIDDGAIPYIKNFLENIGFFCKILRFQEEGSEKIINLYAKYGNSQKNLAFAGHTDVVPTGDLEKWQFPPFSATIKDDILYGRGTVDMKGGIGSFLAATAEFLQKNADFQDSISFIITGDEEAIAINGTVKMVEYLQKKQESISHCIVGEPSNPHKMGEMIKVGRRGSINFIVKAIGKQGHAAYPQNALNPITELINTSQKLINYEFDQGNEYFDATHLEITSFDVANETTNIIPQEAVVKFNIRFSSEYNGKEISEAVKKICQENIGNFEFNYTISGESFYNQDAEFSKLIAQSVQNITNLSPTLSTGGGTSDARFIKNICPCIELGLISQTAHQIDENVAVSDIITLKNIYLDILKNYFK